jgi:hypothetical protein
MANKINFSAQGAPARKLKPVPDKYKKSPGRPNISQSDGIRPAFPLMPYTHLPESFMDVNKQDWVVIPKGRLVSAITSNNQDLGDGADYFGVPKGIMGLMVPANGGWARQVTSPVEGGGTPTIPANIPLGVAEHDVYQDMRGEYLNYDMLSKNYGVLSRQLIKIPSVDLAALDTFIGTPDSFADTSEGAPAAGIAGDFTATSGYWGVEPKFSWLTIKAGATDGLAGQTLRSDSYGNFMAHASGSTAQQVGRLLGIDYRFNKDLLDTVQSVYEDNAAYRVSGTGTMGVPQFLYDFAYAAIGQSLVKNSSSWAAALASDSGQANFAGKDAAEVVSTCCSFDPGVFGEAWIQLNV